MARPRTASGIRYIDAPSSKRAALAVVAVDQYPAARPGWITRQRGSLSSRRDPAAKWI
jgi:hypothetical protein